ncbi:unnamed protein product [Ceutorhynchus assimilis]|uniref:Uncharacterized protein n=1 Tax=Ceutorhynchus assimilis TaxID=467358 RepID=A0A9N9MZR2_9CUCU|nr:unnamed protein product [Ceutorhynchus assimilis]
MLVEHSYYDIQIEKSEIAKHFRENVDKSRSGKKLNLNLFAPVDNENEDRTEENLIEDEESTESIDNDDDDEELYDEDEFDDDDEEYDDDFEEEDENEYDEYGEEDETEANTTEMTDAGKEESNINNETIPTPTSLPDYEPFFPELSESTDVPVLLLKTTIVSNIELETKVITTTRLRTYTYVVTRVAGNEEIITSTTEVKPQIKTTTVVESATLYSTLTLLDLDNMDKTDVQPTFIPTLDYNPSSLSNSNLEDNPDVREEPRNLATRVMSNGVEVIVAGDKTTYPGDKDFRKAVPSIQKAVTLKPSTLSDHMLLMLPQEETVDPSTPLDPNQFVVKTCLTTFTYLTTYLEKGLTTVSSHEQVVSNVATEERINTGKILPTPAMGITLTQYPALSVRVFHTTYTYLNTILDGEQPLVISSKHVVANTVTALDDHLATSPQPSIAKAAVKDTNTYFSTINLEKTLYEDGHESVISTREVVTQVVITESIPLRDSPVMTSYIALDMMQDNKNTSKDPPKTTDVTKTYFVTYTYFNTVLDNGVPKVYTNVSTESDVVVEKVLLQTKKPIIDEKKKKNTKNDDHKFDILATRVYFTTFTYFTTLLKENDPQKSTIINSRTKVVQNVVTETLEPNLFDSKYLESLSDELKGGSDRIQKLATLGDGQQIEITVRANEKHNEIEPTKTLPIQKTEMPLIEASIDEKLNLEDSFTSSKPNNIITGSTIVFVDDDPFANLEPTPDLASTTAVKNNLESLLSSEVVKKTRVDIVTSKVKKVGNKKSKDKVNPSKAAPAISTSAAKKSDKTKKQNHPAKISSTKQPVTPAADLLGLGSINIKQVLTPVLSAMAGYINKNLKSTRRNDANSTNEQLIEKKKDSSTVPPAVDTQNRSPVYIPVRGMNGEDFEIAESQNIASFDWSESQEASLLGHNGIPISPGDIITANSDVIVGKPGRVGPRLPSAIPLHHETNEVPFGMKPPPLLEKPSNWKNRQQIAVLGDQVSAQTNIIHAPNKDDYVGPPPPLKEKFRGEKRKHIPLAPHSKLVQHEYNNYVVGSQYAPQYSGEQPPPYQVNANNAPVKIEQNLQETIHKNYQIESQKQNYPPIYASEQQVPIVLPEVIERSTGQPLLVQLQPSQVAFVNIPFNRTTALIYGGSTETHHNGQYFDDPSPYPEPEFNPIESFKNGAPQFASVYQDTPQLNVNNVNTQQVSGVIKVGTQVSHAIKVEPDTSANEKVPVEINPSRPVHNQQIQNDLVQFGNAQINIQPPPLSFGQGSVENVQVNTNDKQFQNDLVNFGNAQINVKPPAIMSFGQGNSNHQSQVIIQPPKLMTFDQENVHQANGNQHQHHHNDQVQFGGHVNVAPPKLIAFGQENRNKHQQNQQINFGNPQVNIQNENIYQTNGNKHQQVQNDQLPVGNAQINTHLPFGHGNNKPTNLNSHHFGNAQVNFGQENNNNPNAHNQQHIIQPPPLSFGMVEEHGDVNAHIINHEGGNVVVQLPNIPLTVYNNTRPNYVPLQPTYQHKEPMRNIAAHQTQNELSQEMRPPQPVYLEEPKPKPNTPQRPKKPKYPYPPKRNLLRPRPRPQLELSEFMTPPPPVNKPNKRPPFRHGYVPNKERVPIPLMPEQQHNNINRFASAQNPQRPLTSLEPNSDEIFPSHFDSQKVSNTNHQRPDAGPNFNKYHQDNFYKQTENDDLYSGDEHLEDDLPNEDGEVVQESNSRPSKVPIEVLQRTTERAPDMVRFPDRSENGTPVRFPYRQPPSSEYYQPTTSQRTTTTEQEIRIRLQESQTEENNLLDVSRRPSTTTTEKPKPTIAVTSQKPVLIFIDEHGQQSNFLNRKPTRNNRPKVTSLPIDTQTSTSTTPKIENHHHQSQTEKPFDSSKYPSKQPTNEVNIAEPSTAQSTTINPAILLNSEAYANITQQINSMEVLQPPPLVDDVLKVPSVSMEPPRIDVNSPGKDIVRVPHIDTLSEEMVPPSPETTRATTEIVLGMNPPPLVSTHKPILSMEVDIPSSTTKKYERPRLPPLRRQPGYRRTTTSTTTPTTPYQGYFRTRTTASRPIIHKRPENNTSITPTPTIKSTPSMEVIVGQPQDQASASSEVTTKSTPELIITIPQDLNDIITKPIHHGGNEVKIIDEAIKPSISSKSPILPTRYITHTKTHTVTITKTTVVKTLGGPPSTLTILVTKTEKSYIVDTVTEFHTLVRPTNIVETVTTTIENSLYPAVQVRPSAVVPSIKPSDIISSTGGFDLSSDDDEDSLEDFIIKDSDSDAISPQENYDSNESIFVVMTDKNKGTIIKMPPQTSDKDKTTAAPTDQSYDTPHRDEITENEVDNALLAGILIANQPLDATDSDKRNKDRCSPECKPSRNELCQKVEGVMRCVCRPGFARMFPDRPCNPTYTYSMNITIDKFGKTPARYSDKLAMENTTEFIQMARKVHEALDRMVMQSDLRDVYHGVHVTSFYPASNGVVSGFYLQLSDNIDEIRMEDIFKKYLRNNNYSLGGTDVIASQQTLANLRAQDFNECENPKLHDCSENAQCFNLRGTYTCSCKEGYSDLSENMLYPGRICSAEQVGCEKCNYHGTCYTRGSEELLCECFHWYAGENCQVNLKVLLIALVTLGTILFALLLVCIILTCVRKKPKKSGGAIGFLPQRVGGVGSNRNLDRRAMIEDTSSEDSRSETNSVPPYVQQKQQPKLKPPPPKGALKKVSKVSMTSVEHSEPGIIFPEQKDRSLTVMIPRAKYHPAPPTSPMMNYTTFDARKPSIPSVTNEAKLLSYLDAGPSPSRADSKRKYSNALSEQFIEEKPSSRKTSGALISAGFEVSATVGTLGTTCGTEADRSENATLIQKISADLLSRADTSSQFNTLRKSSLVDDDLESNSNWMDIPRISTVSESRSYDETTIPPPMKSFTRSEYDTKSLTHQNDEANTMAERDLGSTFLLPHTHLYKPDRGSDISGFESL